MHTCSCACALCFIRANALGVKDPKLQAIGRVGRTSTVSGKKNMSRKFHNFLEREKRALPVKVTMVQLRVKVHKPRVRERVLQYPFIRLLDWGRCLLLRSPKHLLGGFDLADDRHKEMFARFWQRYRLLDPSHPVYGKFTPADFGCIIPYALHGDEGRGKAKTAVLVTSFQPIIGYHGEDWTNMKGCLCCSSVQGRFFFVFPGYPKSLDQTPRVNEAFLHYSLLEQHHAFQELRGQGCDVGRHGFIHGFGPEGCLL